MPCRAMSSKCAWRCAAGLAFNRVYKPLLDPYGITYPQYLVMISLWEKDGQPVKALGEALTALGGSFADVVRTRMYITDAADADLVGLAHGAAFKNIRPASTMLVVPALIRPEWKVEIEAEAIIEK